MSYGELLPAAELLAYYKLESDGTDYSGKGKNLTKVGSPTVVNGKFGFAANLPGVTYPAATHYYYLNDNLGIDGGACTFSFWYKNVTDPVSGAYLWFFQQFSTGTDTGYSVFYGGNTGARTVTFRRNRYSSGFDDTTAYNVVSLPTTRFTHFVHTYDGTNVYGYINGKRIAGPKASSGNGSSNVTTNYTLGAYSNNGSTRNYQVGGIMDEFFVLGRAWSATEVINYYNQAVGRMAPKEIIL